MGVLAAVLADAGRVALDVPGVERCVIEWRSEDQRQSLIATDELRVHLRHRHRGATSLRGTGEHAPRLRDRINPALGARASAKRRAIVEKGPQVPVAVPAVPLKG